MNRRQLFQRLAAAAAVMAVGVKAESAQAPADPQGYLLDPTTGQITKLGSPPYWIAPDDWHPAIVDTHSVGTHRWPPPVYTPADDSNIVYISEAQIEAMLKSPPRWDRTPAREYAREQAEDGWDTYLLRDA